MEDRWCVAQRAVTKEQADRGFHLLDGAARLHMKLHDEIAAWLEPPGEVGWDERRHLPWRPAEKVPFGIPGRARHQPVVPGRGIRGVELPRGRRRIDADIGVMDDARVAWVKLDASHEARPSDRQWDGEDSKDVGPRCGQAVRGLERDDEIGRAEQPSIRPSGPARQIARIAFRCSHLDPPLYALNLARAQTALANEVARLGFSLPRRHEPAAGHVRDLRG